MHQHRHVTGLRGKLLGRWVADGTEDFLVLFDVKRSLLDHFFSTWGRVDSLSQRRLENPLTDAGVNTDEISGELISSFLVSLLGQRSVISSSEWAYLRSNRACYCSFICLCLWTHCSLGGCVCTLCSSCDFPSDLWVPCDRTALARLLLRFFGIPYFADSALILCQSLLLSRQQKEYLHSTLYLHRWGEHTGHDGRDGA